jgi:hypothetical protein
VNWKLAIWLLAVGAILFRFPWLFIVGPIAAFLLILILCVAIDMLSVDGATRKEIERFMDRKSGQFAKWLNRVLNGGQ